jgi:hypothetical protein
MMMIPDRLFYVLTGAAALVCTACTLTALWQSLRRAR